MVHAKLNFSFISGGTNKMQLKRKGGPLPVCLLRM